MSEFGSAEMKAVTAAAERPRDDRNLAHALEVGNEENRKQAEAQAGQAKEQAQLAKDIERVKTEIAAIQAVIDDENRNARDQEKLSQRPDLASALNVSIAIRTEELREKRLALPASLASMDVAGLEAALVGKQSMLSEFETRKDELESKLVATGSI